LVDHAEKNHCDLVSLMVRLRCESGWEKLLIPAFVFFFAKLYPFRRVNHIDSNTAAAAGGCSLVKRSALEEIGGIAALKNALIDDCTLAAKIKRRHRRGKNANIWLGLSNETQSLRPYDTLDTIWNMVARTAYTQLYYSPFLLVGTLFGMGLVYFAGPIALVGGLINDNPSLGILGLLTYGLMSFAYSATIKFYRLPWFYATAMPPIALLYTLMTWDSALKHWRGKGGNWKGRNYSG
jgi:hopene-associated glycosyltransferase HpnB